MIHGSRTSMTPPPSSAPLDAAAPLPPVHARHARRADEAGAALRAARVTGRVGDWLLLDDHAGRARRADGCLLAPDIGDSVLIWTSAPAGALADDDDAAHAPSAYVLAVLARAGAPQAALALPGGVVLETGSAHRAHVRAAHLDACARSIDGRAHDVRLVARRFTSTIGRALHTLGDCLRRVCGVDELHAARARWRVDERAHLHARDVTLLADRHVGIDGERIDLG
ncbi:DUF3540 domain-containing protein [Burkholderia pseudomallei]|uniref:DUF3540 domain-containing protein n=1 Tax=Burkholderia pseudomallei TaxID=28450 RepID=UPI000F08889D|nr:DUF3540 domain-containing protein [Burkholderia pseudomallei]VCH15724.1 type VI secretion system [Burkholderia pseudomallei]